MLSQAALAGSGMEVSGGRWVMGASVEATYYCQALSCLVMKNNQWKGASLCTDYGGFDIGKVQGVHC